MFIRWKTKSVKNSTLQDHLNYVQLVRTDRTNGKPRQKVIKYLASIRESHRHLPSSQREFWQKARENLNELLLDKEEKEHFIHIISRTIPLP